MKELVKFMVEQFIDEPGKLAITETEPEGEENKVVMTVSVAPSDMGKIIGKQGRIAKAIRTIVKASQAKVNKKYTIEIVENQQ